MFYDGPVDCLHATYVTRKGAKKMLDIYAEFVDYDEGDPILKDHIYMDQSILRINLTCYGLIYRL